VSREEAIEVKGKVVEVLPNSRFRVELPNGHCIMAHISGRVRLNFVKIASGDIVTVEMSPFDLSKGCIAFREEEKK
jgi:translation initiation factor IF-1